MPNRAQSEVVGVVILVGVFAVLAVTIGVLVIGNVTDQESDAPLADLNASANSENLTLVHGGGDALDATDVDVVVRQGSNESRYGLESFTEHDGENADRFASGEAWRRNHSLSQGVGRVLVVHTPSNAVVHDERFDVPG